MTLILSLIFTTRILLYQRLRDQFYQNDTMTKNNLFQPIYLCYYITM
uniref:Uncharacterized protein n=1 Tax=Siphoviridae sp. ctu8P6 TaxID=2827282 RepID=A0A8S5R450_9CAUD|nr:MAG TPA: hypothetical protein [Siphoviridae sp. ctu8P6]